MNRTEYYGVRYRSNSLFFILCLCFVLFGCMDSDEYKPDEPPFDDPPEPPTILLPEPDAELRSKEYCWVVCDWTDVEGAQSYEMQRDTTPDLSYTWAYGASPGEPIRLDFYPPVTTYYFRVRAYSSAWTWYTAWSETRRFYILPVCADTIFPPE